MLYNIHSSYKKSSWLLKGPFCNFHLAPKVSRILFLSVGGLLIFRKFTNVFGSNSPYKLSFKSLRCTMKIYNHQSITLKQHKALPSPACFSVSSVNILLTSSLFPSSINNAIFISLSDLKIPGLVEFSVTSLHALHCKIIFLTILMCHCRKR